MLGNCPSWDRTRTLLIQSQSSAVPTPARNPESTPSRADAGDFPPASPRVGRGKVPHSPPSPTVRHTAERGTRTHHACGARYTLTATLQPSTRCPDCQPLSKVEKWRETSRVQQVTRLRARDALVCSAREFARLAARRVA